MCPQCFDHSCDLSTPQSSTCRFSLQLTVQLLHDISHRLHALCKWKENPSFNNDMGVFIIYDLYCYPQHWGRGGGVLDFPIFKVGVRTKS